MQSHMVSVLSHGFISWQTLGRTPTSVSYNDCSIQYTATQMAICHMHYRCFFNVKETPHNLIFEIPDMNFDLTGGCLFWFSLVVMSAMDQDPKGNTPVYLSLLWWNVITYFLGYILLTGINQTRIGFEVWIINFESHFKTIVTWLYK